MTTTTDHLETVGAHLFAALSGDLPPSFKAPETAAVLDALVHLTDPADQRNATRLGLLLASVLMGRLKASMRAERASAIALQQHRLQ